MATLYTVSYPELQGEDYEWIERIRRTHDPQFKLIRPHFTLVFGCDNIPPLEYIEHVESIAENIQAAAFICQSVTEHAEGDSSYLYLIPDKGSNQILEMHRKLHIGAFRVLQSRKHRFSPHVTLARSQDARKVHQLANQFNAQPISITGKLSSIEVCSVQAGKLNTLARFNVQA